MIRFWRNKKKGQIAPFMIAVIVILLIALMVTVNLGKISLTKTDTANAADAGALAGASTHANSLNAIADINSLMIADYLSNQAAFLIPINMCKGKWRYVQYLAFVAAQTAMFIQSWDLGGTSYESARNSARQLAFSNVGIDEAKPRQGNETYEEWLKRESNFGQWMDKNSYEKDDNEPVTYSWEDKKGGQNSVTVTTDAPDFPGLIPEPGLLVGLFTYTIGPCSPKKCMPCVLDQSLYFICYTDGLIPPVFTISFPKLCCSCKIITLLGYPVPIAFIFNIKEDEPEIQVTVNRIEPEADLGLWRMKYESQGETGKGITSRSAAKSSGGRVGPVPAPDYDSYLISVD